MKPILLLTIVSFVFLGCNSLTKEKELSNLISGEDYQFWDYEWPRSDADQHGFTFKFEKNGNLTKYSFNKSKNERRIFSDYPSSEIDNIWKWNVRKDSILFMITDSSKIVRYTEDTIFLEKKTGNEKMNIIMIRVKDNLNIVK
ncbi:MAG: hypothetical protein WBF83_03755 [Moheibacter sp.]